MFLQRGTIQRKNLVTDNVRFCHSKNSTLFTGKRDDCSSVRVGDVSTSTDDETWIVTVGSSPRKIKRSYPLNYTVYVDQEL